jgi:hypothetical protein
LSRFLLQLLTALLAVAAAPAAAFGQAQNPPPEDPQKKQAPSDWHNDFHLRLKEFSNQPYMLPYLRVDPPAVFRDQGNLFIIDRETWFAMPQEDPKPATPVILSVRVSSLRFDALGGSGIANRIDPTGSQVPPHIPHTPPPGGGDPQPTPPSKPLFSSSSGSTGVSDSDTPLMSGPELDMTVIDNLDQWKPLRWLPEASSLDLYARIQFGTLQLFGRRTSLQMYSMGPRLALPLHRSESFELNASAFAGAGFVRTGIGDALGFDGGLGLSAEQKLGAGVSLYGSVEAELFASKGTSAFGPAFNIGINVGF